jgi:TATA-binding protein-associated factor
MKDLQAMDRAHRLGQKRAVQVYRLITKDTLEEKIMGLQKFKLNIASSVVNVDNTGLLSMNTGAVLDLLQEEVGAHKHKHPHRAAGTEGKQLTLGKMLEEIEERAAALGDGEAQEDLGIQAFLDNL